MESLARGETDVPLLEETIGATLARTVAAHPDREALVEVASGSRWTWREFDADVDRLARALMAAGVDVGDRVGIWAANCAQWRSDGRRGGKEVSWCKSWWSAFHYKKTQHHI